MTGPAEEPVVGVGAGAVGLAAAVGRLLAGRAETLAVAESLTGGLLAGALTAVPGASGWFRGGVVVYTVAAKARVLGVPAELLDRYGPVHERTARAMARAARESFAATYGLATTGVAGPEPHGGRPVGTVYVGWAGPAAGGGRELRLAGDREQIRRASVVAALDLLAEALAAAGTG